MAKAIQLNAGRKSELHVPEYLTANRTYYVRADGNDNNTGLIDSAGGAFLTLTKLLNVLNGLSGAGRTVTVMLGAGSFASPASPFYGYNFALTFQGVTGTVITGTFRVARSQVQFQGPIDFNGLVTCADQSNVLFVSCNFPLSASRVNSSNASTVTVNGCVFAGASKLVALSALSGSYLNAIGCTSNVNAYSIAFCLVQNGSVATIGSVTDGGAATGARASVELGGLLILQNGTNDSDQSGLPGNQSIQIASGGRVVYLGIAPDATWSDVNKRAFLRC